MIRRLDVDLDAVCCDDCGRQIRSARITDDRADADREDLCARCGADPDEAQDRADALDAQEAADRAVDAYERWIVRGGER